VRISVRNEKLCECDGQGTSVTVIAAAIQQVSQQLDHSDEGSSVLRCHIPEQIIDKIGKVSWDSLVRSFEQSIHCLHRHNRPHLVCPRNVKKLLECDKYDFGTYVGGDIILKGSLNEPVVYLIHG
jgi:hypothetical protein